MHRFMLPLITSSHREDRLSDHLCIFYTPARQPIDRRMTIIDAHCFQPLDLFITRGQVLLAPVLHTQRLQHSTLHLESPHSFLQALVRLQWVRFLISLLPLPCPFAHVEGEKLNPSYSTLLRRRACGAPSDIAQEA